MRWSGQTALCEVLAGPGAKWGDVREGLRERAADGSQIELMIDGERASGRSEERFSLATLALDLLATGHG